MMVMALDPSGNFKEGKGITGIAIGELNLQNQKKIKVINSITIKAKDYSSQKEFWNKHIKMLNKFKECFPKGIIVIEDFKLQRHKAMYQSGSGMETIQLIGILKQTFKDIIWQLPAVVKPTISNQDLVEDGLVTRNGKLHKVNNKIVNRHQLDALRHLNYFAWKENKKRLQKLAK